MNILLKRRKKYLPLLGKTRFAKPRQQEVYKRKEKIKAELTAITDKYEKITYLKRK